MEDRSPAKVAPQEVACDIERLADARQPEIGGRLHRDHCAHRQHRGAVGQMFEVGVEFANTGATLLKLISPQVGFRPPSWSR